MWEVVACKTCPFQEEKISLCGRRLKLGEGDELRHHVCVLTHLNLHPPPSNACHAS